MPAPPARMKSDTSTPCVPTVSGVVAVFAAGWPGMAMTCALVEVVFTFWSAGCMVANSVVASALREALRFSDASNT